MTDSVPPSLERGADLIRRLAATLPEAPGVYRMLDAAGEALYVGKARALRRRVSGYAQTERLPKRLQMMVAETRDMVFVRTHTEAEALLLESNLIKKLKPRYNILLRDDKSFPYIMITGDHDFPLLTRHRGAQKRKGDYYGPFANAGAAGRTVTILQKAFMLRNCSDSFFAGRTRPCLQYHIKRCTAPCVGLVSRADYAAQVRQARDFLSGKSAAVQEQMAAAMQAASDAQDYESAAKFRDRIKALSAVQARQDINIKNLGEADVFGLWREDGRSCVQVFFFRGGHNYGNRAYFPRHATEDADAEIFGAFVAQFYENKPVPKEVIVSHALPDQALLEEAFAGTRFVFPKGGARKRLADFAVTNAREALERESLRLTGEKEILANVADLFGLNLIPKRIEVYDNSHISGTNMVGAMIVAGPEGFRKNAYRTFNIRQAGESDDYGMMREVMRRRFGSGSGVAEGPDLLLIDGGKGQLAAVTEVLEELGIAGKFAVVSIAKGPDRNAGREKFFMAGRPVFQLPENDPALHYLQRLRDEAHRFAIGAHRSRRAKQVSRSPLDDVPGIGPKRKKALLNRFGSGAEVARAGLQDLQQVDGISRAVAEKIYFHFHAARPGEAPNSQK